jgi:membrane protein
VKAWAETFVGRVRNFFENEMWTVRLRDLSPARAFGLRYLRIIVLAIKGFMKDDCAQTASVLTYYSLLNVVPFVAMIFAVAKGFGLDKFVQDQILQMAENAKWQAELTNQILHFADALLRQAKGGLIAGFGSIMILYTVISILGRIEGVFNKIWSVRKGRTMGRRFSDYTAIMVVGPMLFALSGSMTVLLTGRVGDLIRGYAPPGIMVDTLFFLLGFVPYLFIWALLIALYKAVPNTNVPIRSALIGGIASGTMFQIVQWAYIRFQIGVASYGAIYGSFAALPLLLVWLQTSWMIILFGAELARAESHYETFGYKPSYSRISNASRKILMARIMRFLVTAFQEGREPPTIRTIAFHVEIPVLLVERVVEDLLASGFAVEVKGKGKGGPGLLPARAPDRITVKDIFDAGDQLGTAIVPVGSADDQDKISAYLRELTAAMEKEGRNFRLKDE